MSDGRGRRSRRPVVLEVGVSILGGLVRYPAESGYAFIFGRLAERNYVGPVALNADDFYFYILVVVGDVIGELVPVDNFPTHRTLNLWGFWHYPILGRYGVKIVGGEGWRSSRSAREVLIGPAYY
jgi:hypothetical protein